MVYVNFDKENEEVLKLIILVRIQVSGCLNKKIKTIPNIKIITSF